MSGYRSSYPRPHRVETEDGPFEPRTLTPRKMVRCAHGEDIRLCDPCWLAQDEEKGS